MLEPPITSKKQMYGLFKRGRFGNAGLNFDTIEAAAEYACKTGKKVAIRLMAQAGGGAPFYPSLDHNQLLLTVHRLLREGWTPDRMQFSAMQPDDRLLLQGYLTPGSTADPEWALDYNDIRGLNMREGMKHPKHLRGARAYFKVKSLMDATSWDQLQFLIDEYPEHTIEFSIYDCLTGNLQTNTVFWEVRLY